MKSLIACLAVLMFATAASAQTSSHRFVVESATPPSTQAKAKSNDASLGVHWLRSYSTADKAKTYSLYEAPNADAVRKAAALNKLTVTNINDAPVGTFWGRSVCEWTSRRRPGVRSCY